MTAEKKPCHRCKKDTRHILIGYSRPVNAVSSTPVYRCDECYEVGI